jgi:hypothetical protein
MRKPTQRASVKPRPIHGLRLVVLESHQLQMHESQPPDRVNDRNGKQEPAPNVEVEDEDKPGDGADTSGPLPD